MIAANRYFTWCVLLLVVVVSTVALGQDQAAAKAKERELIAVLKSDVPKADKAIPCKQLAIYGTDEAVPALAPLLADPELSSWARIALEAIPGPVADAALRDALDTLDGRLLVGTINSIAVRRDTRAVDGLIAKLDDSNANVASAAAVALGHIGGEQAAKALGGYLTKAPADVRSAVAEGCVLCAEWYLAQGRPADAVKLYDAIRAADVPNQRHLEAIRGAILARGANGVPLLIEQIESSDKGRVGIGLRTARELPGQDVTEALADELNRLSPNRRPLLLLALADRHDAAVLPTVVKAAKTGSKDLRITAIGILIELGDVSSIPTLLDAATEGDAELKAAAMETLARLRGKAVDTDLLARLPQAKGRLREVLIVQAGQRQIAGALPTVVTSVQDSDARIRSAAVQTIGILGQEQEAAELVKLLQTTKGSKERSNIEKALLAVTGRCGQSCVLHLKPLTQSSDDQLHMIGLHALAIVGGPDGLTAVQSAIDDATPTVQTEAVRILSTWPNNWPDDAQAGAALLTLAKAGENRTQKVLGLRGYLQYIRGNSKLGHDQKVAKIKDVRPLIARPEEERLAIAVLGEAPSAEALELLTTLTQDPAVAEEAYSAIVRVAGRDVPGLSKEQRKEALQTVAEKSKNNGTKQRARQAIGRI